MSNPATMSSEELARRLGKGRTAMVNACRTFCRTAVPIAGKLTELEIGLLLGAAVEIAKAGKRIDYMITLFAALTGGQVSEVAPPDGLRTADNDGGQALAIVDGSPPPAPVDIGAAATLAKNRIYGTADYLPATLRCPHGVPLENLCPDCDLPPSNQDGAA